MDTMFKVNIEVTIHPTFHDSYPEIKYGIDNLSNHCVLEEKTTIQVEEFLPEGKYDFLINFYNKTDTDCIPEKNLDKFITISNVKIGNLSIPRFLWIAEYVPCYPEPWYSEQIEKPPETQVGATVLGFNGQWKLSFESPIYSWIHTIENLGWIWPVD